MTERHYLISSYMAADPVTISPDATLGQVVETMTATNTYTLVVTGPSRKVVGIVSITDLIKEIVPDYLEDDLHVAPFATEALFAERVAAVADHSIDHFMTKRVHTIKPSHTIMEAAALLTEHRIRQLPVVDDNGQLVGYIGRTKIRQAIADVLHQKPG